eukprot:1161994-Pelagomonas_calceolata.AAC.10
MGIRRVTSSSLCLILVIRIERSLSKSASGAGNCKFRNLQVYERTGRMVLKKKEKSTQATGRVH